jgi:hypothetical protein
MWLLRDPDYQAEIIGSHGGQQSIPVLEALVGALRENPQA